MLQEDRVIHVQDIQGINGHDYKVFGVLDGHGGDECSSFCQTNLPITIEEHLAMAPNHEGSEKSALIKAFESTHEQYVHSFFVLFMYIHLHYSHYQL